MNFAGLAVISELDDWIGEQICTETPLSKYDDTKFKTVRVRMANINERMKLLDKMALLKESLEIEDDQNVAAIENVIVKSIGCLMEWFPWFLFPLLTLPLEWWLVRIQPHGLRASRGEA